MEFLVFTFGPSQILKSQISNLKLDIKLDKISYIVENKEYHQILISVTIVIISFLFIIIICVFSFTTPQSLKRDQLSEVAECIEILRKKTNIEQNNKLSRYISEMIEK